MYQFSKNFTNKHKKCTENEVLLFRTILYAWIAPRIWTYFGVCIPVIARESGGGWAKCINPNDHFYRLNYFDTELKMKLDLKWNFPIYFRYFREKIVRIQTRIHWIEWTKLEVNLYYIHVWEWLFCMEKIMLKEYVYVYECIRDEGG